MTDAASLARHDSFHRTTPQADCDWCPTAAESASDELRRAGEDLVKADAAGVRLVEQLRAAWADVEVWKAHAAAHLAECLRLEKLVIERTKERDEARRAVADVESHRVLTAQRLDVASAELASARQELALLRADHTPIEAPGMSALTDEEFAAINPEEAADG